MSSDNYDAYYASMVERLQRNFQIGRNSELEEEERIRLASQEPTPSSATLKVSGLYMYPEQNAKNHRTSKFELVGSGTAVLRRGQSFFMALKTPTRGYDETRDTVKFIFNFGPRPSPINNTQYTLTADRKPFPQGNLTWAARIVGSDRNAMSIEVQSSPDTAVGIWRCQVQTRTQRGGGPRLFSCPEDIYMLFNPWEPNDITYMPDTDLLSEYVLEDVGKVWFGPMASTKGRHWNFGQFGDCVLPLVMILLEKSGVKFTSRGNPIMISRALSKMVNSNDDDGLLVGRWDEKYGDGTAPAAWTGSLPILEKYFNTMKPVKYGQCWVFASVLCTVCRAVGLPCRVVTNFVSAHDSNCSLSVDMYYNDKNELMDSDPHNPNGGKDSIWNFHVWDDVWMARPDLPKGYGGWQAIDSTPQETSDGFFQCGPASVAAIRKGQVGFAYDVPFLLAEVNADVVHWKRDKKSDFGFSRMNCNTYHVGRKILTKKPNTYDPKGDTDAEDITADYKNKEGTRSERLALINGVRGTTGAPKYFDMEASKTSDVEFDLVELDTVPIGEPFDVLLTIKNNSDSPRTIQADLGAESMYYTGLRSAVVKKASGKFTVDPNDSEELKMTVSAGDYMNKLVEYGIMKISAMATVDETKQSWFEEDDFQVTKPPLNIEVNKVLKINKEAEVIFKFTNPLKTTLTACRINYEGPGYTRFGSIDLEENVKPLGEMSYTHKVIPKSIGTQRWVATFSSKELIDIIGSAMITIVP